MSEKYRLFFNRNDPFTAVSFDSSLIFKTGNQRSERPVFMNKVAPCRHACPIGIDIAQAFYMASEGDIDGALRVYLQDNPLPGVCGRVCYHPCESECNRGHFDEPVNIRAFERFLSDRGYGRIDKANGSAAHHENIAVIGSGPSGLSATYHLARLGYQVTLFEAREELGGMMRYGIPGYRLPESILDREIDRILSLGVDVRKSTHIGDGVPWKALDRFQAVYLSLGKQRGAPLLGSEVDEERDIISGLEFLSDPNASNLEDDKEKALIIGGGNVALDAARTLLRLRGGKGENILIVCPESRDEMAALPEEVQEALEEGLTIITGWAPLELHIEEGRVRSLEFHQAKVKRDGETGKMDILRVGEKVKNFPAQKVIVAIGQTLLPGALPDSVKIEKGSLWVDPFGRTSDPRFYAGGDVVGGKGFVADAIADGKMGALSIDCYFRGQEIEKVFSATRIGQAKAFTFRHKTENASTETVELNKVVPFDQINTLFFHEGTRGEPEKQDALIRKKTFDEVIFSLEPVVMEEEILRCFKCGTCIQCDTCKDFCPDISIILKAESANYDYDLDYCKGCGVCSVACPRNVIEMVKDSQ